LRKEFRRDGFTYRQIAHEDDAAMYEQTWNGNRNPSVCYEVIRIRGREGFQIGGRFVEAAEVYPNSEAWGVDGFTTHMATESVSLFAPMNCTQHFWKRNGRYTSSP